MSEILVRVPLTGQSDFHPLALAPGLPMLDVKKLTYQVLLGWFGDLLAEPELDQDGVAFHVQTGGRREEIVERTLATEADLTGPLESDFERLKKALFDVKPVSPSERLIFNRLQPPIGNYDGFLYRVLTKGGSERLVWCWGFQCRNTDARAMVCPNAVCSTLLQQVGEELEDCPHCNQSLLENAPSRRRSRFPLGAFSAATVLLGLCGGTVWLAASRGDDMPQIPGLAMLERMGLNIPGGLSAGVDKPPNAEVPDPTETKSDQPQPPSIILPDPAAEALDTTTVAEHSTDNRTALANEAGGEAGHTPAQPPQVTAVDPQPAQLSGQVEPPAGERPSPEPATTVGTLTWHQDYQTAYQQATQQRRQLLVVFRDTVDPDSINSLNNGLAVPGLATPLDAFVRLVMPANTTIPGQSGGTLLLEHRAFRHLNLQPGIAIVDLTDPESTWYGRVVSALPQSPNGRFSPDVVKTLLDLPHGTVTHRSVLLALRTANPESRLAVSESSDVLNRLADRNCRFMAQYGQAGAFEPTSRRAAIASEFGETAQVRELFFAADDSRSIQDAAVMAVESWLTSPDGLNTLNGPVDAYGLEMFQAPDSGRWFATLLMVVRP